MEDAQESLERQLMELLLRGDHPILAKLRLQYTSSKVTSREFTGVGFFTSFEVAEAAPRVEPSNFAGGNVNIELEGVPNGAMGFLFVRAGKLDFLECVTFTDPWPERLVVKSLSDAIPAIPK